MKQGKIIQAYNATEALSKNDNLSADTLWSMYMLRKTLQPHVEFQIEREKALKEKYSKYADETGKLSGESYLSFMKELNELLNLEKDINLEKFKFHLTSGVTVQMMESLDDFVVFEK